MKYKKVTVKMSNEELDALEDYLVCDFGNKKDDKEKCRKRALKLWMKIVKEFDKKKKANR